MLSAKTKEVKGRIIATCPHCKHKEPVGAYAAAQLGCGHTLEGNCEKCGRTAALRALANREPRVLMLMAVQAAPDAFERPAVEAFAHGMVNNLNISFRQRPNAREMEKVVTIEIIERARLEPIELSSNGKRTLESLIVDLQKEIKSL